MNYYIEMYEWNSELKQTARVKARDDIDEILKSLNYKPLRIPTYREEINISISQRLINLNKTRHDWGEAIGVLNKGDVLFVQYPLNERYLFFPNIIKKLQKRGVKVIALIHDLEILRRNANPKYSGWKKALIVRDERDTLKNCLVVISHNKKMSEALCKIGLDKKCIVELGIFDYLTEEDTVKSESDDGVIIAGNLIPEKAGYVYKLPDSPKFNLYGPNYELLVNQRNVHYFGAYNPEELPGKIRGAFGLVWDGESDKTCEGYFGNYLKYNNPHKVSLYLASGIPIIIWKDAALADFVSDNGLGLTISSLDEIDSLTKSISNDEYKQMLENVARMSAQLRNGYFTKRALNLACGTPEAPRTPGTAC